MSAKSVSFGRNYEPPLPRAESQTGSMRSSFAQSTRALDELAPTCSEASALGDDAASALIGAALHPLDESEEVKRAAHEPVRIPDAAPPSAPSRPVRTFGSLFPHWTAPVSSASWPDMFNRKDAQAGASTSKPGPQDQERTSAAISEAWGASQPRAGRAAMSQLLTRYNIVVRVSSLFIRLWLCIQSDMHTPSSVAALGMHFPHCVLDFADCGPCCNAGSAVLSAVAFGFGGQGRVKRLLRDA